MSFTKWSALAFATVIAASPASAAIIAGADTGLAAPGSTIGFEEVALLTGDTVTNQFAAFGATFTPRVTYFTSVSNRPNFSGPSVIDFSGTDIAIQFTGAVTEMAAAMTANFGAMTVTSRLNGVVVETFDWSFSLNRVTSVATNQNNFFGFTNSLFDEVLISPTGNTIIALDNLSFTVAAIPVPATLPLLIGALGGIALMRRRRAPRPE